ncbi:hypothetical protein SporoS204_01195 [Sporosarcina ureae]|uniref:Uncharacterized protein n=1 Tax=Sporosarcina ureae TaxID=1571 RepID=A0ABM6JS02_SPOUR|nr:hypothetical protein SporoS204_01195 [Sporosarcina ureae]
MSLYALISQKLKDDNSFKREWIVVFFVLKELLLQIKINLFRIIEIFILKFKVFNRLHFIFLWEFPDALKYYI